MNLYHGILYWELDLRAMEALAGETWAAKHTGSAPWMGSDERFADLQGVRASLWTRFMNRAPRRQIVCQWRGF